MMIILISVIAPGGAQETGGGEPDVPVHDQLRVHAAGDQEERLPLHPGGYPATPH